MSFGLSARAMYRSDYVDQAQVVFCNSMHLQDVSLVEQYCLAPDVQEKRLSWDDDGL